METLNVLLVGDRNVGKTTLLNAFATKSFQDSCFPNVFDYYLVVGSRDNIRYTVRIWDISSGQSVDTVWIPKFNAAQVVVLCFALDNVSSFENVKKRWIPEAGLHAPGAPLILVGTKSDLRSGDGNCVTEQMGQHLQDEDKVFTYLECSAKDDCRCLTAVLSEVARVVSMRSNTITQPFPSDVTVTEGWLKNKDDLGMYMEALKFNAPLDVLTTQLGTAKYLDIYRARGHKIFAWAGWAIEGGDKWRDIYCEAYELGAPPCALTTRERAHLYIDAQRAAGRKVKCLPAWVTSDYTEELYNQALVAKVPPRTLCSRMETELFLLNIENSAETSTVPWWSCGLWGTRSGSLLPSENPRLAEY